MGQHLRRCFNGFCLLSLLVCLGTAFLWWRGRRSNIGPLRFRLRGERYGLRVAAGRAALLRLPPPGGAGAFPFNAWAGRVRNDNLTWFVVTLQTVVGASDLLTPDPGKIPMPPRGPGPRFLAAPAVPDEALRPLFDALDDPERFAAAHTLLCWLPASGQWAVAGGEGRYIVRDPGRRQITASFFGLRMDLPPGGKGWDSDPFISAAYKGPAIAYDRSHLPMLRDFWFDALSVPAVSVPLAGVSAAASAAPLLWLGLRFVGYFARRRRHRRLGHCVCCGYDLTGNASGICSECGKQVSRERRVRA